MNRMKNRVSNTMMLSLLLFMTLRQLLLYTNINILQTSSFTNDISFILIICILTLFISVTVIYLPILFITKVSIKLPTLRLNIPCQRRLIYNYQRLTDNRNIYQLYNVVRC